MEGGINGFRKGQLRGTVTSIEGVCLAAYVLS
jgi:hypothetical protein